MNQSWAKDRQQATQTINVTGCVTPAGTTPADLDFIFDGIRFVNGVFVFGELKFIKGKLSTGQRLLLEHLVSNLKCRAIAIYAKHDVEAPDDIPLEKAHVQAVYANFPVVEGAQINQWLVYGKNSKVTVGDIFKYFFEKRGEK